MKFQLIGLDESLFSQKMRYVFKSLVDAEASYPHEDTNKGFLRSIPSNYGYVFFWYGWLDDDALSKYYVDYVSEDRVRRINEERRDEGEYFSLKKHIEDVLFPIVYDHPDVIVGGFAEVYLAITNPDIKEFNNIERVVYILRKQAKRLEELNYFIDNYYYYTENRNQKIYEGLEDIEVYYWTIKFADLYADEEEIEALKSGDDEIFEDEDYKHIFRRDGWEINLKITFDGDDTLRDVVDRIDRVISPLKGVVDKMIRFETSYYPF